MQTSFQNISKIETSIPNDVVPLNMQPHKKKKGRRMKKKYLKNLEKSQRRVEDEYLI